MSSKAKKYVSISPKQAKAIFLLSSGMPGKRVADEVGVALGTVHNWKSQDQEFRMQLRLAQRRVYDEGISVLKSLVCRSATSLGEILDDPEASRRDRIAAAQTILRSAGSISESLDKASERPRGADSFFERYGLK